MVIFSDRNRKEKSTQKQRERVKKDKQREKIEHGFLKKMSQAQLCLSRRRDDLGPSETVSVSPVLFQGPPSRFSLRGLGTDGATRQRSKATDSYMASPGLWWRWWWWWLQQIQPMTATATKGLCGMPTHLQDPVGGGRGEALALKTHLTP